MCRTHLKNDSEGYEHPKLDFVISSVARNLVLQHIVTPFLQYRVSWARGTIGVEDEISRYARNDRVGAWFPTSKSQARVADPSGFTQGRLFAAFSVAKGGAYVMRFACFVLK